MRPFGWTDGVMRSALEGGRVFEFLLAEDVVIARIGLMLTFGLLSWQVVAMFCTVAFFSTSSWLHSFNAFFALLAAMIAFGLSLYRFSDAVHRLWKNTYNPNLPHCRRWAYSESYDDDYVA